MERYKLEWVVTSSSPVVQFKAEWKMAGKAGKWQTEIVQVSKIVCSPQPFFPEHLFFWVFSPRVYYFLGTPFSWKLFQGTFFLPTLFLGVSFSSSTLI